MSSPQAAPKSASAPFWQARTGAGIHPELLAYSHTIQEDAPFVRHDLAGSVAHVCGLRKAGLLTRDEAARLVDGLQAVAAAWEDGSFQPKLDLEDLHMNVEALLTERLGDLGRKLHSGRSRNDQVATCITLHAREAVAALAEGLHALAGALASRAKEHARTPWTSRTHAQPAQPATLGFLLAAHAHRFQALVQKALESFERLGESPLGSGAVAGSTLPLDPAYTAKVLGLRPPSNALLATGTRDAAYEAVALAAHAGLACSSLAQDLMDLFGSGCIRLPDGYTTGSSLMPQKRNPDTLELARGRGKALHAPLAAAAAILGGMGLGYQRDFQLVKPCLSQALADANATVRILASAAQGFTADARALAADWAKPGVVATDVAEALVQAGLPFRTAYGVVAKAFAQVEQGTAPADALAAQGLPEAQLGAALAALLPDPARRATAGGPAPQRVLEGLAAFEARALAQARGVAAAVAAAAAPLLLLSRDANEILET